MAYKQADALAVRTYISKCILEGMFQDDIMQQCVTNYNIVPRTFYRHLKYVKKHFLEVTKDELDHTRALLRARYEKQYKDACAMEPGKDRLRCQREICDSVARLYGVDKGNVTTNNIFNYFPAQSAETKDIIADYKIVNHDVIISNET